MSLDSLLCAIILQANHVQDGIDNHGQCIDCAHGFTRFCLHNRANNIYPVHTPLRTRRDGFDGWRPTFDANYDQIDWTK